MKQTLDEALRPLEMICVTCGSKMTVYPNKENGTGVCPTCSPNWLGSFARFQMNQMRIEHGLQALA